MNVELSSNIDDYGDEQSEQSRSLSVTHPAEQLHVSFQRKVEKVNHLKAQVIISSCRVTGRASSL